MMRKFAIALMILSPVLCWGFALLSVPQPNAATHTLYGIVYTTATGTVKSIVLTSVDSDLVATNFVPASDTFHTFMTAPLSGGTSQAAAEAAVKAKTGLTPGRPTSAIINNSTKLVTAIIQADPAHGDVAPNVMSSLIAVYSPLVKIGDSYDSAAGLFSSAPYTIPANTPANPTANPVNVPATVIPKP